MGNCILVTGGAGFIGSHTCVALAEAGYTPLILDNLGNSDLRVLERLARISGTAPDFIEGDVRDRALLDQVFARHEIAGVIHFAGLKAVGDSVAEHFQQERYRDLLQVDPVRLIEAVVACVGFVAAGTILRGSREDQVSGLTTASSLIMAAAIGIAVGISKYVIAIGVSVLCVLVLAVMRRLEKRIP